MWAKFSPWLHSARLWPINPLGCFHSIIKYGLLTACYGPQIVRPCLRNDYTPCRRPMDPTTRRRPMDPTARRRSMDHTARRKSMDPTARKRPMDPTARRRPTDPTARRGPWLQQSVCCLNYCGLVTKNRLLWPLEKHRKRTEVTTSKQPNKTIRK